ncbi:hypothetical protein A0H81_08877 [Grifola frondosa]|uniref:DUF6533 domain-containing protein n=1 Tax=Grifola frondosa TaxID=5627 RepID=A0A1C7M3X0_GRIFR|nr:hypothetical protein A0H81_08877 [Grifola frondosa]
MDAASVIQAEALLIQAAQDIFVTNLCTAAAVTWLAYDILLTIRQEIDLIWSAKLSLAKILYFFARYYIFLCLVCKGWLWFEGLAVVTTSGVFGEALLLLRIYASYGRSKTVLIFIVALYLAEIIMGFVAATLEVGNVRITPRLPNFPIPGCVGTAAPSDKVSLKSWILIMTVACIYFLMALYTFFREISFTKRGTSTENSTALEQNSGSDPNTQLGVLQKRSPLMFMFVRDAAFYFFLVFAGTLLNLICALVFSQRAIEQMGTVWSTAIYSIVPSRLCLNLRGFVSRTVQDTEGNEIELGDDTLDVEFAEVGTMETSAMGQLSVGNISLPA